MSHTALLPSGCLLSNIHTLFGTQNAICVLIHAHSRSLKRSNGLACNDALCCSRCARCVHAYCQATAFNGSSFCAFSSSCIAKTRHIGLTHVAAKGNHVEVLRLLLRAGAEKDAPTHRGKWTPLHLACWYISVECVQELLRWGAAMGQTAKPAACADKRSSAFLDRGKPSHDGGPKNTFVSEEHEEEEEEECDDAGGKENGYGKTPAEVIGLKNLAADNGGSVPSVDPSLDEEEEQMVVLGDDDGEQSPKHVTQAPDPSVLPRRPSRDSSV